MFQKLIVYAQETDGAAGDTSGGPPMWPMLVMFFAIMWFLLIRPNQKRDRERREMLSSLSKGDRVVTNGGMCGTIVGLNDRTVVLKISEDPLTKVEFLRQAIAQVPPQDSKD